MTAKIFKRLPYGNSNFESVRTENYAYVDNSYVVLKFDFSGIDTSGEEEFKRSFSRRIQETVLAFISVII